MLGNTRQLEIRGSRPLQIAGVDTGKEAITVRLTNASEFDTIAVAAGGHVAELAWAFHEPVAAMLADAAHRVASRTGLNHVVLSGGCFLNALLARPGSSSPMPASSNRWAIRGR